MSDDNFWAGVVFGGILVTVGAVAVHRFNNESYQRGWNGEQLVQVGPLGILGQTNTGATVLVASFEHGAYDREVRMTVNMHTSELQLVSRQAQQVSQELKKIEDTVKKAPESPIPAEKRQFLDDLYDIAQTRFKKNTTRPARSYTV
jgi:hypothetical protein